MAERRCRRVSALETGMQCSRTDTVVRGRSDTGELSLPARGVCLCVVGVDGAWSAWSSWSQCSVDCRRYRRRHCDNARPAVNLGRQCPGPDVDSQPCAARDRPQCTARTHGSCTTSLAYIELLYFSAKTLVFNRSLKLQN